MRADHGRVAGYRDRAAEQVVRGGVRRGELGLLVGDEGIDHHRIPGPLVVVAQRDAVALGRHRRRQAGSRRVVDHQIAILVVAAIGGGDQKLVIFVASQRPGALAQGEGEGYVAPAGRPLVKGHALLQPERAVQVPLGDVAALVGELLAAGPNALHRRRRRHGTIAAHRCQRQTKAAARALGAELHALTVVTHPHALGRVVRLPTRAFGPHFVGRAALELPRLQVGRVEQRLLAQRLGRLPLGCRRATRRSRRRQAQRGDGEHARRQHHPDLDPLLPNPANALHHRPDPSIHIHSVGLARLEGASNRPSPGAPLGVPKQSARSLTDARRPVHGWSFRRGLLGRDSAS